jgi:hypothetical protein
MLEPMSPGLCGSCRHCHIVETARSTFYLCRRALTDPGYRKYPVLPVRSCPGHEAGTPRPARDGAVEPEPPRR